MKYLILFFLLFGVTQVSQAQSEIEKIDLMGTTYTVTKNFPQEILGTYLYEKKGEPIVELNENGEGVFQPHSSSPIKINFWIDCDENGTIRKKEGAEGIYQYTILIQFLDGNNRNYPVGNYDLMGVTIRRDLGYAIIYGERFKPLSD
jgi:hypothetical protein